jgi:hypothetical protein
MWIAIVGGALGFIAALIVVKVLVNRARAQTRDRLTRIANGRSERKLSGARSFGLKSKGAAQVRGNGALALFDDELVFVQLIPATEIRVPRKDITSVGTITTFNGKSSGAELLMVEWRQGDGTDAAAWQLHGDVRGWVEALEVDQPRG